MQWQDGINETAKYICQEECAQVGIAGTNLLVRKRGAEDVFAGREVGKDQYEEVLATLPTSLSRPNLSKCTILQ